MKPKHPHLLTFGALALVMPATADVIYSNLQDIAIPATFDGLYPNVETGAWNTPSNLGAGVAGWDVKPFQRREALPMNGARGTLVAVPPFVPAVPVASGFHSRKASGIPRKASGIPHEAKGLVHPSPGQGRLGGHRLGLKTKKHPQAEGLPHHSANRHLPRHEAGLQPAIDLSPFPQGVALGQPNETI